MQDSVQRLVDSDDLEALQKLAKSLLSFHTIHSFRSDLLVHTGETMGYDEAERLVSMETTLVPPDLLEDAVEAMIELCSERSWYKDEPRRGYADEYKKLVGQTSLLRHTLDNAERRRKQGNSEEANKTS